MTGRKKYDCPVNTNPPDQPEFVKGISAFVYSGRSSGRSRGSLKAVKV